MTVSDPIADMLTRIRNAVVIGHTTVALPNSKLKTAIAKILKDEGYISNFEVVDGVTPGAGVPCAKYVGERREKRPVITAGPSAAGPWVYAKKNSLVLF
jgi:small subunit ribosomal protein S8